MQAAILHIDPVVVMEEKNAHHRIARTVAAQVIAEEKAKANEKK